MSLEERLQELEERVALLELENNELYAMITEDDLLNAEPYSELLH